MFCSKNTLIQLTDTALSDISPSISLSLYSSQKEPPTRRLLLLSVQHSIVLAFKDACGTMAGPGVSWEAATIIGR